MPYQTMSIRKVTLAVKIQRRYQRRVLQRMQALQL